MLDKIHTEINIKRNTNRIQIATFSDELLKADTAS